MFDLEIDIALQGAAKFNQDISRSTAAVDKFGTTAEKSVNRSTGALGRYRSEAGRLGGATSKFTTGLQSLGTASGSAASSISSLAGQVPGLGSALTLLSNPITLVVAGLAALGTAYISAIGVAKDFEKQVADTAAIVTTGFDTKEAQRQIGALSDEFLRLGSTTEFTASQAAQGAEFLGRAGFQTDEILVGLKDTLALATVGNLDLARSADIASNVLSQFGLEAEELGRVVDVIAKTTTSSNTNVQQLAEAFNYIGPTASALNVSLEETASVVGLLANNGLQGSIATRALGTSLVRLAKPTAEAQRTIEELGIQAFDSQGNFVGLANLIGELETAFDGLSVQQQQAALTTIFGAEAIQEFSILLKTGSDEIRKYTDQITEAGLQNGAFAESIREAKLDNFQGAIIRLQSAWEGFQITISQGTLPVLKELTLSLAGIIQTATDFVNGTTSLGELFGPIGTDIEELIEASKGLGAEFGRLFDNLFSLFSIEGGGGIVQFFFGLFIDGATLAIELITDLYSVINDIGDIIVSVRNTIIKELRDITGAIGDILRYVGLLEEEASKSIEFTFTPNFDLPPEVADAIPQSMKDAISRLDLKDLEVEAPIAPVIDPGPAAGSLEFLKGKVKEISELIAGTAGDSPLLDKYVFQLRDAQKEVDLLQNKIDLIGKPIASAEDVGINLDVNIDTEDLEKAARAIGDIQVAIGEISGVGGVFGEIQESLNLTTPQVQELTRSFREMAAAASQEIGNIAVNAFQELGIVIYEAQKAGTLGLQTFTKFLSIVALEIVASASKYLGLFLLKSAVFLGFPAGIPAAIAGVALLGLSGFLGAIASGKRQSLAEEARTSNITPQLGSAGQTVTTGLGSQGAGGSAVTTITNVSISLETDGIVQEIQRQQIIDGELQRGG